MSAQIYVLRDTQVPMALRSRYILQKLPDFDIYILVRKDGDFYGNWSGLQTKEKIDKTIEEDFELYCHTKQEILDYVQRRILEQGGRATNGRTCQLEIDGKFCAFSLCLSDKGRNFLMSHHGSGVVGGIPNDVIEDNLRPEFRGHSKSFWRDVQNFHDVPTHWDHRNILTDEGVLFYNRILLSHEAELTI